MTAIDRDPFFYGAIAFIILTNALVYLIAKSICAPA